MAIAKSTGKWQTERIGTRGKWHHKSTINWSGHGVVSEDWRQRSDHKPVGNKSRPILIDTPNWDEYNKGTIKTESKIRCTEYTRWKWTDEGGGGVCAPWTYLVYGMLIVTISAVYHPHSIHYHTLFLIRTLLFFCGCCEWQCVSPDGRSFNRLLASFRRIWVGVLSVRVYVEKVQSMSTWGCNNKWYNILNRLGNGSLFFGNQNEYSLLQYGQKQEPQINRWSIPHNTRLIDHLIIIIIF